MYGVINFSWCTFLNNEREFGAFTMDVIARCAFGMKINDLGSKDDQFLQNASKVFNPPGLDTPLVLVPCKKKNLATINICECSNVHLNVISYDAFRDETFWRVGLQLWAVQILLQHPAERDRRTEEIGPGI